MQLASHFPHHRAPRFAGRVRLARLARGLLDVASAAEHLQIRPVPGVAALPDRDNVIDLVRVPAALCAPPAGRVEDAPPERTPAPGMRARRMRGAAPTHPAIIERKRRRAGRSNSGAASPAAITAAESRSIRPRDVLLSSPGFPFGSRRMVDLEIALTIARLGSMASFPLSTSR